VKFLSRENSLFQTPLLIQAHPRDKPNRKNDRVIKNLDQMFPTSRVVQLESLTFKEQVQLIANAKRLRGGLGHEVGVKELLFPKNCLGISLFHMEFRENGMLPCISDIYCIK
jgi:hypothetical protein